MQNCHYKTVDQLLINFYQVCACILTYEKFLHKISIKKKMYVSIEKVQGRGRGRGEVGSIGRVN